MNGWKNNLLEKIDLRIENVKIFHSDSVYKNMVFLDKIAAKTLKLSELAQMSRIEFLLPEYLDLHWRNRKNQASERARIMVLSDSEPEKIAEAIRRIMLKWSNDTEKHFNEKIIEIYKLARIVGVKKALGEINESLAFNNPNKKENSVTKTKQKISINFDSFDKEIISIIKKQSSSLIKNFYDSVMTKTKKIIRIVKEILTNLKGTKKNTADFLKQKIKNELDSVSISTFEDLISNAMTTVRAYGQLKSFKDENIVEYEISNPTDSKTCKICSHMNGKVFTVQTGIEQLSAELNAKKDEDMKRIHPWLTISKLQAISSISGYIRGPKGIIDSIVLATAGLSLPTYHHRCRCTVDIHV